MKFDEDDEFMNCPYCKGTYDEHGHEKGLLLAIEDWSNMHNREVLLHCWDCDRKYLLYYKLDRVVELIEHSIAVAEENVEETDDM